VDEALQCWESRFDLLRDKLINQIIVIIDICSKLNQWNTSPELNLLKVWLWFPTAEVGEGPCGIPEHRELGLLIEQLQQW
jgi:hypothetical protein